MTNDKQDTQTPRNRVVKNTDIDEQTIISDFLADDLALLCHGTQFNKLAPKHKASMSVGTVALAQKIVALINSKVETAVKEARIDERMIVHDHILNGCNNFIGNTEMMYNHLNTVNRDRLATLKGDK